MDDFMHTVRSQTFALDAWDMTTSFSNIPFIYIYKNPNGASAEDFMPFSRLRSSFYRALKEFPILAGNITVAKDGHTYIDVDKNNLNMPEYLEADSQVHFKDLEDSRFNWSALPKGLYTVNPTPTRGSNGKIRLANVNAVRLRNNSGLVMFISIGHFVVDGIGYCKFVNRWAEIARWMASGAPESELPVREYLFDRSIVRESLPSQGKKLSETYKQFYGTPSYFGRWLAWLSPEVRGAFLDKMGKLTKTSNHLIHISKAALDALRWEMASEVPANQRVSENDVISALLARVTAKAIQDYDNETAGRRLIFSVARQVSQMLFGEPDRRFLTLAPLDARPRVQKLKSINYTGNSLVSIPIFHDVDLLTRPVTGFKELAPICTDVRNAVDDGTGEMLAAAYCMQNQTTSHFAFAIAQLVTIQKRIIVTNQSRFTLYQNDFGEGIPEWVYPMSGFPPNMAVILPVHPSSGGVNVFLTHKEPVMKKILADEL